MSLITQCFERIIVSNELSISTDIIVPLEDYQLTGSMPMNSWSQSLLKVCNSFFISLIQFFFFNLKRIDLSIGGGSPERYGFQLSMFCLTGT